MNRTLDLDFLMSLGGMLNQQRSGVNIGRLTGIGQTDGSRAGQGGDFKELRPYQYGDDPRQIDWRVSARKNEPYFRERYQSLSRRLSVLVDWRPSMFFGTRGGLKAELALENAVVMVWSLMQQQQSIVLSLVLEGGIERYPIKNSATLLSTLKWLSERFKKLQQIEPNSARTKQDWSKLIREDAVILSDMHDLAQEEWRLLAVAKQQFRLRFITIADTIEYSPPQSSNPFKSNGIVGSIPRDVPSYFSHVHDIAARFGLPLQLMHYQLPLVERIGIVQKTLT